MTQEARIPLCAQRFVMVKILGMTERETAFVEGASTDGWIQHSIENAMPWEKRARVQQKGALKAALQRIFAATLLGQSWISNCPQARREALLKLCEERSQRLLDYGWSSHERMEWLMEIKGIENWDNL